MEICICPAFSMYSHSIVLSKSLRSKPRVEDIPNMWNSQHFQVPKAIEV